MEDLLKSLGLKSLNDFTTKLNNNIFEIIDVNIIKRVLDEYNLKDENLLDNEESKYENINRILMLKHGKVIDPIKEIDNDGVGYKLEMLTGGFQE